MWVSLFATGLVRPEQAELMSCSSSALLTLLSPAPIVTSGQGCAMWLRIDAVQQPPKSIACLSRWRMLQPHKSLVKKW